MKILSKNIIDSINSIGVLENHFFVIDVNASDLDVSSVLTYHLDDSSVAQFDINSSNGKIYYKIAPDFEDNRTGIVKVYANDGEYNSSIQTINISVIDIEEIPPIPQTIDYSAIVIDENSTLNIIDIDATDANNSYPLSFSIVSGVDKDIFEINKSTGILSSKVLLDYDIPSDNGANNIYNLNIVTKLMVTNNLDV